MKKHRELFVPIEIRAISGNHYLLKNNNVPIIGYISDKKRYTKRGGCIVPREVCFHYGTKHSDFFYFENMNLEFMAVTIKTPEYLTDVYLKCAQTKNITPEQFISKVVDVYVNTQMGFLDE
ncbi:MAG: hypothetical protein ACT4ON_11115 [Bacteroidota bacterium]